MAQLTELPSIDRPSETHPDETVVRQLSNEHAGAVLSMAVAEISVGLMQNVDREAAQAALEYVREKGRAIDTKAVLAGISLDEFAQDEDRAISGLLADLESMDTRLSRGRRHAPDLPESE